jgi:hypothetical protein
MSAEKKGQTPCQDAEVIEERVRRTPRNSLTRETVQAKVLEHKEEPVNNIQVIGWIIAGVSAFVLAIAGLLYLTRDKDN